MKSDNQSLMIKSENLVYKYSTYDDQELSENKKPNKKNKLKNEIEVPIKIEEAKEEITALSGVSLEIKKGEFVAILGHNGSGKSTFAKHINALLSPTSGSIFVDSIDTSKEENVWEIRQIASMVFQNPDNQIIATIVEEDVAFGPENLGIESSEIRKRVDQALETVGMSEYATHSPHFLSGGQKQRVAIAGILAMKPKCIILDEPTAMLDPSGRKEVMDTIISLNKEGITIVLITHYMEEAVLASRVVVMDSGIVVMDNCPKEVFKNVDKLKELGLDVPQITQCCHELQKCGLNIPSGILFKEEMIAEIKTIFENKSQISTESININYFNDQYIKNEIKTTKTNKSDFDLQIKNLTHTYNENTTFEKKALDDVSFTVKSGEFIGLIGHTGSGKSTLIQHLNLLIKPTSGSVFINDEDITLDKTKIKYYRQKVGLVFQYPEHQLFEMTIFKDVAFGPTNMGLSKEEINSRVIESLAHVNISEDLYEKSPFELSGGQKRRVAIAGVLAMKPDILVLDEPTAGLDPKGRDDILGAIKKMHETTGITVILVSHSMEDIAVYTSKIIVMDKGKIAHIGTPSEVFKNEDNLKKIGLATPQISSLLKSLKTTEVCKNINDELFTVKDARNEILKQLMM